MQVSPGAPPVARRRALLWGLAGGIVALDQATKSWAVGALDERVNLVGDSVGLEVVRNSGSAFSLFTGWTPILGVLAVVLIVVLWRMSAQETDRWTALALAVVLGGALGNLSDRIFRAPGFLRGAVIDFVDVGPWPTFNIADAAITVGAVLLFWRGLRREA